MGDAARSLSRVEKDSAIPLLSLSSFERAIITINTMENIKRVIKDLKPLFDHVDDYLTIESSKIKDMKVTHLLLKPFLSDFNNTLGKKSFLLSDQGRNRLQILALPHWKYLNNTSENETNTMSYNCKQEISLQSASNGYANNDLNQSSPRNVLPTIYNANNAIVEDPLEMDLNSNDCLDEILRMMDRIMNKSDVMSELGIPFACDGSPAYQYVSIKKKHSELYRKLLLCPGGLHTVLEATRKLGEVSIKVSKAHTTENTICIFILTVHPT